MKLKNPNYKSKSEQRIAFFSDVIVSFIQSLPASQEYIDFDFIRSEVDKMGLLDQEGIAVKGSDLTDAVIDSICKKYNLQVIV